MPIIPRSLMFEQVCAMNEAFGNPPGRPEDFDAMPDLLHGGQLHYDENAWSRLQRQCENIAGKLYTHGPTPQGNGFINGEALELLQALAERNPLKVRDALCDIMVFTLGAYHFMGYDADADMDAVLAGVMTRFCQTEDEVQRTLDKWNAQIDPERTTPAAPGAPLLTIHGEFPRKFIRAAADLYTLAGEFVPKGKFLKSVGYRDAVFPPAPVRATLNARSFFGSRTGRMTSSTGNASEQVVTDAATIERTFAADDNAESRA